MRTKLRTVITLAIILSAVELQAQKSNPRGIYHMVSITGKYGTEDAMFDQYKICTDTMTWMLSVMEDGRVNQNKEKANRPYFELGDNDHMVFNYTGEEPDTIGPTKTRIYNSNKKGFTMKWWSTARGHSVFPENAWCIEQYESNNFSDSGKKIFDMLYITKNKVKKDGLQGRWKVIGAIKMSGSKIVDEWQKSGKLNLNENDYVPYQDEYAIIDDQYIFTAYSEVMLNPQTPNMMYGYLQEYKVSDENKQTITAQLLTNDQTRSVIYEFYRISNDRMIVKEEHVFFDYRSDELSPYVYAIWERTGSNTPIIQQLTTASTFKDKPKIEPRGLYRYVAGGTPCRIREVSDSVISLIDNKKRISNEAYRLCTDTINWNIVIGNYNATIQGQKLEDILNYQRKQINITNITNSPAIDDFYKDKWTLFDCSETGFSESWPDGITTYDKRGITPLAKEMLDVCDGKIPYDANHPLYGTWEVEGRVLNPSEAKIDSIMKGLCTDYVFHYMRNSQLFYAFTPQHWYTTQTGSTIWVDKLNSDSKTKFVTWEPYFEQGKGTTIVYLNWTMHWIDKDTLLICRDHQELRLPALPECLVLKRKVGGESLVNVIKRKNTNNTSSARN